MLIFDRFPVGSHELTAEGYMLVRSRISRVGLQDYWAWEFGLDHPVTDRPLKFYRPAEEVFHADALASFGMKPVTVGHPSGGVSATNWKEHAVGTVGVPSQDGDHVRAMLLITDAGAINEVQRGTVELSCGYDCFLDMTAGTTPEGEAYDGVMREIRGNHVAIVPEGRCGPSCKIGDAAMRTQDCPGKPSPCQCHASKPTGDHHMKTVTIDGATFEVADDKLAAAIVAQQAKDTTMLGEVKTLLTQTAASLADMKAKQEAADKAAAEAKAAQEAAEAARPTDAQIAKMAADRSALVDSAKKIDPAFEAGDKSAADIRLAVVTKKLGDAAVKDRSADYIAGLFDTLLATAGDAGEDDPIRAALKGAPADKVLSPRDEYLKNLTNAWKA